MTTAVIENGKVTIRKHGADRIRRGHLWVYRSDVVEAQAQRGDIVAVQEARGAILGKAFYSSKSEIALRLLARGAVSIDETFFRHRFAEADRLRERIGVDPALSRRIYSEGDLLPGLIVDRYGDRLVVQSLTQGADRLQPLFIRLLDERYRPRSILIRNDSKVRELEGLESVQHTVGEPLADPVGVSEDGKHFLVSLSSGQKTGLFLDQRGNHQASRRYAHGRALDAFTYSGGFAVHMSDFCERVEAVDLSEEAIAMARENVRKNGLANVECVRANVFDFLRMRFNERVQYDTIVLDPPAFARNRESLPGALRGYKEINSRAMRLLRPGGILISCSCSHHVTEPLFAEMLAEAARDASRLFRVLERRIQAPDHPILLTVPETLYLKCFILEVLY